MLKYVAELKKRILEGLNSEIQLGQFLAKCAAINLEWKDMEVIVLVN